MASFGKPRYLEAVKAGADLTGELHRAGKMDANGDIVKALAGEGFGFIMSESTSGQAVEFAVNGGDALGIAAGAVNEGDLLKSDANGALVAATNRTDALCRALEDAVAADHFRVQVLG